MGQNLGLWAYSISSPMNSLFFLFFFMSMSNSFTEGMIVQRTAYLVYDYIDDRNYTIQISVPRLRSKEIPYRWLKVATENKLTIPNFEIYVTFIYPKVLRDRNVPLRINNQSWQHLGCDLRVLYLMICKQFFRLQECITIT
jgi:hypothetical protein